MSAIKCYDSDGRLLKSLFQWDKDQTVRITGVGEFCEPVFHICNPQSDTAVVVTPDIQEDGSLIVRIPNFFLTGELPIVCYLYTHTQDDGRRTVHAIYIPITARPMPDDYEFDDDLDFIKASELTEKVDSLIELLTQVAIEGALEEVVDIRIGYDGTVYDSAGDAVRALGEDLRDLRFSIDEQIASDEEVMEMIDEVLGTVSVPVDQEGE